MVGERGTGRRQGEDDTCDGLSAEEHLETGWQGAPGATSYRQKEH